MTNTPDLTVTQEAREQIMRIIGSVCYSERSIPQATDDVIATIPSRPEAQARELVERLRTQADSADEAFMSRMGITSVEAATMRQAADLIESLNRSKAQVLERHSLAPRDGGEDQDTRDSIIAGMCMTWDHSFGLMSGDKQNALWSSMSQLYEHDVKPAIDRALATLDRGKAQVRDGALEECALAWEAFKGPYLKRFGGWGDGAAIDAMQTLNRVLMPISTEICARREGK